jgi:hypothetical protein
LLLTQRLIGIANVVDGVVVIDERSQIDLNGLLPENV